MLYSSLTCKQLGQLLNLLKVNKLNNWSNFLIKITEKMKKLVWLVLCFVTIICGAICSAQVKLESSGGVCRVKEDFQWTFSGITA